MTLGEDRVRVSFNPSDDKWVVRIKHTTAALIDILESRRDNYASDGERQRLISEAQTRLEDAAMWAVKAVT